MVNLNPPEYEAKVLDYQSEMIALVTVMGGIETCRMLLERATGGFTPTKQTFENYLSNALPRKFNPVDMVMLLFTLREIDNVISEAMYLMDSENIDDEAE